MEVLKLVWPLVLIQIALQVYCLYDLWKKKETKNLNVVIWVILIILGEIVGAAAYLLFGRSED